DKLAKLRLIRVTSEDSPSAGPERRVLETTAVGKERLADALEGKSWVNQKVHQAFLIWLALSWRARPRTFRKQLTARKKFIEERLVLVLSSYRRLAALLELVLAPREGAGRYASAEVRGAALIVPSMGSGILPREERIPPWKCVSPLRTNLSSISAITAPTFVK